MSVSVAILAGGQGSRLKARSGRLPKPMVPVCGRPLLAHQIEMCRRHGFTRIALLVHYEHEVIRDHFGDGSRFGVDIEYCVEATPRGTAGALRDALPRLGETVLVLYGDTYFDVDLRALWQSHLKSNAAGTLFVHPNDHPHDSDLVEVDADGMVQRIHPYPHPEGASLRNLVNAALYVLQRDALSAAIPESGKADLAKDTFGAMLAAGHRLKAYVSPEYIKDMGTPERLDKVERDIAVGLPERLSGRDLRAAVFIDRDGTINKEVNHLRDPGQLELLEGAAHAIRRFNRAGVLSVVVTNQPVIARGELDAAGLGRVHATLETALGRDGAYLDGLYVCPHHPHAGFAGEVASLKIDCDCRKPKPGLIEAACRDLGVRRADSWMVGDTSSDIEAGRMAGCRTVLVRTGYAGRDDKLPLRADYVVPDLAAAADWILAGHAQTARRLASVASASLDARLVLFGGLARAGKSSAAQVLKELLHGFGRRAHVVSLDGWLRPAQERPEGAGVLARFDTERMLRELSEIVHSRDRLPLRVSVYDRATRGMLGQALDLSIGPDDVLIVEGVPALLLEPLRALAQVTVHVALPEPARLERLHADYRWRGYADPAQLESLLRSRAADESIAVQDAARFANFQLSSEASR